MFLRTRPPRCSTLSAHTHEHKYIRDKPEIARVLRKRVRAGKGAAQ